MIFYRKNVLIKSKKVGIEGTTTKSNSKKRGENKYSECMTVDNGVSQGSMIR